MWESSVPVNNDIPAHMFVTANLHRQLINSCRNPSPEKVHDQAFQLCQSINKRFTSHVSDDDQVFSDEDDDEGGATPKLSKRKGPHEFLMQLDVQDIHVALNAPMVNIKLLYEVLLKYYLYIY